MLGKKLKVICATALLVSQLIIGCTQPKISAATETSSNTNFTDNQSEINIDKKVEELNNSLDLAAYVVIDSKTGEKIIGNNEDAVLYPASLTKIITSLLLLESGKLNDSFTVSKEASSIGEASIYVQEGEVLSGKDLLHAMMLASANDACYVVAENISGTAENFYKLMNSRAKELGAKASNFSSANGLHEDDHVSSAMDIALITREALKYPEFRDAINQKTYELTRTSEKSKRKIQNLNKMLFENNKGYYNEYCIGGKTAYTRQAGNCLMEVVNKDGMEFIVVALKAGSGSIYTNTNKIINFVYDNFKSTPILDTLPHIYDYNRNQVSLYAKEGVSDVGLIGEESPNISTELEYINGNKNVIKKDEKVGTLKIYKDNTFLKNVDLFSAQEYEFKIGLSIKFLINIGIFIIILIFIKILLNLFKLRKLKRKGYLKNSKLY